MSDNGQESSCTFQALPVLQALVGLAVGGGTADEGAVSQGAPQSHWLGFPGFVLISRLRGTIKVKKEIIGIKMTGVHPSLSAPHGLIESPSQSQWTLFYS